MSDGLTMRASLAEERSVASLLEGARRGERIELDDGVFLLEHADPLALGLAADRIRRKRHGNAVYFRNDLNLNPTNVCVASCGFCSFYRKGHEHDAYTFTIDEVRAKAEAAVSRGVQEFHVVGGLHPDLPVAYYEDFFRTLKQASSNCHVQGLTAVEVDYLARLEKTTLGSVLTRLRAAGLDSLPGGGAEIFDPAVRKRMMATKIGADRWLAVHREAHALGIRTNATMLYGHVEELRDRVTHMDLLRRHQDEELARGTVGYQAFVPLAYNPENNELERRHALLGTTGLDDLRTVAFARIFLDNFDHVKLPWVTVGKALAQTALSFGCDDVGGAAFEERILQAAGGRTWEYVGDSDLPRAIRQAGFSIRWTSGVYDRQWSVPA